MAKFNFDNSRYAKFFADAGNMTYLQTFVDETGIFLMNDVFWKSQMSVKAENVPTNNDGVASYTVIKKEIEKAPMLDMRAPLGDALQSDVQGVSWYSGSIPDFIAKDIKENATQRLYKEKMFEQFGNDKDIVMAWTEQMLTRVKSGHSTLSNLTAALISDGFVGYEYGQGIKESMLADAKIPASNKLKAGAKIWSAPDCKLITQMAEKEFAWRQANGLTDTPMRWKLPRDTFYNVFLKNAEVNSRIVNFRMVNKEGYTDDMAVTEKMFNEAYLAGAFPEISPIEVITEMQYDLGFTSATTVHGWNPKHAVLCPAGFVGEILKTETLDRIMATKYGATDISSVFASLEGGLMTIVNTSMNNGRYKEWHSGLIMSAIPTLTMAAYHVIVDITVAD